MFALVDCNNFYASCERVFRPELNGKPIVVLSNNDGCVIARSNEAKTVGIPMGAAAFKYKKIFEQHQIYVFSANFSLYGDMSNRVMTILAKYAPEIEIYSIDEAFLKLEGFQLYDLQQYGEAIHYQVKKWTGIPVSVGIAPTKSLSKLANRIAKKFPAKTQGVYIIDSEEKRIKALKWLKIGDVWGIGRRHAQRLLAHNISSAYAFTQCSDQWVKKYFSIIGLRLKWDLSGTAVLHLEKAQLKKSIATTRSFEANYTHYEQLHERIVTFANSCAEKLRKQHSCCQSVTIFIYTNSHQENMRQYRRTIVVHLPFPTNSSIEIASYAIKGLKRIFKAGYNYKKAGVIVHDFTPEQVTQTTLFSQKNKRHIPLMEAIDGLNLRFGQQKIRLASQDPKRVWKMKQNRLSPHYTTDLDDIIRIKV